MSLYDVPVHNGYKILTHTSTRRFAKNGFLQVGNTTLNAHPINPSAIMKSSIYNKNLSLKGISEAGYGQRYPYYGLSYAGAGSPRSSLKYAGAGSPRSSLAYAGAGSPRSSLRNRLAYAGAGSPRTSLRSRLADAYINDNPPPGTLRGLAEDTPVEVDTGSTFGPAAPSADTSGGFFSTISSAFTELFKTTAATATTSGTIAANQAVANAITGRPSTSQQIVSSVRTATNPKTVLGLSVDTLMIAGLLGGAYLIMRK